MNPGDRVIWTGPWVPGVWPPFTGTIVSLNETHAVVAWDAGTNGEKPETTPNVSLGDIEIYKWSRLVIGQVMGSLMDCGVGSSGEERQAIAMTILNDLADENLVMPTPKLRRVK